MADTKYEGFLDGLRTMGAGYPGSPEGQRRTPRTVGAAASGLPATPGRPVIPGAGPWCVTCGAAHAGGDCRAKIDEEAARAAGVGIPARDGAGVGDKSKFRLR